jgi:hypothetical protein
VRVTLANGVAAQRQNPEDLLGDGLLCDQAMAQRVTGTVEHQSGTVTGCQSQLRQCGTIEQT